MTGRNYLTLVQLHTLRLAIQPISDVWGTAYQVGSSLERRDYRDVDVRLMLSDKQIRKHFGKPGALLLANFITSAWLSSATGLDMDFQFQPDSEAEKYDGTRHPLLPSQFRNTGFRYALVQPADSGPELRS